MTGATNGQIVGGSASFIPIISGTIIAVPSTAGAASINIPQGVAPTSPVDGDEWYDSTQLARIIFENGIKQTVNTTIFTATADKTVTNTTAETSVVGTGIGSLTLPSNFFVPGKTVRIAGGGVYSAAFSPGNLTIKIKYGATILATAVITNLLTSASNDAFQFSATITNRTTGSSGTVITDGNVSYDNAAGGLARSFAAINNAGATATINTTTSNLIDVTATFATQSTSNILKITDVRAEILN